MKVGTANTTGTHLDSISTGPGCRSGSSVHSRAVLSFFNTIACMAFSLAFFAGSWTARHDESSPVLSSRAIEASKHARQ